jgi:hypothetical protein
MFCFKLCRSITKIYSSQFCLYLNTIILYVTGFIYVTSYLIGSVILLLKLFTDILFTQLSCINSFCTRNAATSPHRLKTYGTRCSRKEGLPEAVACCAERIHTSFPLVTFFISFKAYMRRKIGKVTTCQI